MIICAERTNIGQIETTALAVRLVAKKRNNYLHREYFRYELSPSVARPAAGLLRRPYCKEKAMHKVQIAPEILARAKLQRGRDHLFETLDMSRTAHIVVDLQVGFMAEGAPVEVPVARDIVDNVNAISKAVRAGGGTNAFLRFTYDPSEPNTWTSWYKFYSSDKQTDITRDAFSIGAENWELWPGLDVAPEDLDSLLKARGIDTLIITGTLTNCCCESSARDAMQMGYGIIFMQDANATLTDAEHNGTLTSMAAIFADVMDTPHLLGVIEKSSKAPMARAS
jgi:ureidoacrylate peracid hydrolase